MGIFPEGQDSRGDHGLARLVEFRFKGPPGTKSSYITTHIIGDHGLGRLVEIRFKGPPGTTSSYITTHIIGDHGLGRLV